MPTKDFAFEGNRLVYDDYGSGDHVVVLLPGLLFSRKMHAPLAETLAERGYRVLCLDLLGHGDSDRPPEMWNYGMSIFGREAIALLDAAEVKQAVLNDPHIDGLPDDELTSNHTFPALSRIQARVQRAKKKLHGAAAIG